MVVVCKNYNEGVCRFGDRCRDAHIKVCKFFLDGHCKHGDRCRDRHISVCKYFSGGFCKHGASCRDLHNIDMGGAGTKGKGGAPSAPSAGAPAAGGKGGVVGGSAAGAHAVGPIASGVYVDPARRPAPAAAVAVACCKLAGCKNEAWNGKSGRYCSWSHECASEPSEAWTSGTPSILSRVRVVPFDLLGSRLTDDKALVDYGTAPDASTVIVDPAKLACIQNGPRGAGIASSYIYKCIGMGDADMFPEKVKLAVTKTGDAKYHAYGPDKDMHVLHAVGPDFTRGACTLEDAVTQLAQTYCNIFSEMAASKICQLRMLPVSYGSNAGKLVQRIAQLTPVAMYKACAMLTPVLRNYVLACDINLCIPIESHVEDFKKSLWLAQAMAAQHAAGIAIAPSAAVASVVASPVPVSSLAAVPAPAGTAMAPPASAASVAAPYGAVAPPLAPLVPAASVAAPSGAVAPPSAWGSVLQTVRASEPLPSSSTSPRRATPFDEEKTVADKDDGDILDLF